MQKRPFERGLMFGVVVFAAFLGLAQMAAQFVGRNEDREVFRGLFNDMLILFTFLEANAWRRIRIEREDSEASPG